MNRNYKIEMNSKMKNLNKQRVIKGLSVAGSVVAAIAAMIAIYQFMSGHSSLFPGQPTTNVPPTSAPTPSPIPIMTPSTNTPPESTPSTDNISANHIDYTFLTWGCWIGIGLLVGALAGGGAGYRASENDFGGYSAGCALGIGCGTIVAIFVGLLSSAIINSLNIQYAFIWNMVVTAIFVLFSSSFIGHVIGKEA